MRDLLGYFLRLFNAIKTGLGAPWRNYLRGDLERDELIVKLGAREATKVLRVMVYRRIAFMVIVIVLSFVGLFDDGPVGDVCGFLGTCGYGLALGLVPLRAFRRSTAYRNGWVDGRGAAVKSLLAQRPPSVDRWLEQIYVFDAVHVLGLEIDPSDIPDDPSGIG